MPPMAAQDRPRMQPLLHRARIGALWRTYRGPDGAARADVARLVEAIPVVRTPTRTSDIGTITRAVATFSLDDLVAPHLAAVTGTYLSSPGPPRRQLRAGPRRPLSPSAGAAAALRASLAGTRRAPASSSAARQAIVQPDRRARRRPAAGRSRPARISARTDSGTSEMPDARGHQADHGLHLGHLLHDHAPRRRARRCAGERRAQAGRRRRA